MGFRSRLFVALVLLGGASLAGDDVPDSSSPINALDRQLQVLVGQLGADQYATREKAQAEIERIGLGAFDALHNAQDHDDVEIALRARYLLRAMPISWSRDSDPDTVRNLLRSYGEQSESERASRVDQLGGLEDGGGIAALCRLARFETSHLLAKKAALFVLRYHPSESGRPEFARLVLETLGSSRRSVSYWLRTYAKSLENPLPALPQWTTIVNSELATLAQFPDRSSPIIVRDLLRWQIDQLHALQQTDGVRPLVLKIVELSYPGENEVEETIEWLIERKYCAEAESFVERSVEKYHGSVLMLYLLAQLQLELGKTDLSQQTSQRALEKSGNQIESRNPIAGRLRDRGLFAWAEREFRQILSLSEVDHPYNILARFVLSEMLHDIEKSREAGEVLQPLVEELDRNPAVVERLQRLSWDRDIASLKSRMHYFFAVDAAVRGDRAEQVRRLMEAVNNDPQDADVLIAMYRLPMPDDAWRENTRRMIREASNEFLKEIARCEMRHVRPTDRERDEEALLLAKQCNQFAWLVGNTEGDLDRAIEFSWKSIELRRPRDVSGYFDTLARCYFSKGDVDAAIKHQKQALKLDPNSGQMRKQLRLFESVQVSPATPPTK